MKWAHLDVIFHTVAVSVVKSRCGFPTDGSGQWSVSRTRLGDSKLRKYRHRYIYRIPGACCGGVRFRTPWSRFIDRHGPSSRALRMFGFVPASVSVGGGCVGGAVNLRKGRLDFSTERGVRRRDRDPDLVERDLRFLDLPPIGVSGPLWGVGKIGRMRVVISSHLFLVKRRALSLNAASDASDLACGRRMSFFNVCRRFLPSLIRSPHRL